MVASKLQASRWASQLASASACGASPFLETAQIELIARNFLLRTAARTSTSSGHRPPQDLRRRCRCSRCCHGGNQFHLHRRHPTRMRFPVPPQPAQQMNLHHWCCHHLQSHPGFRYFQGTRANRFSRLSPNACARSLSRRCPLSILTYCDKR